MKKSTKNEIIERKETRVLLTEEGLKKQNEYEDLVTVKKKM